MNEKTQIMFSDTRSGITRAVEEIFDHFGGAKALLKSSGDVYLKVNAVDAKAFCYTDPQVIAAVITYFKKHGARDIYVIENCTQANITRLVFEITGIKKACVQNGAKPVCLDETGVVPVFLETLQSFVDFSDFVVERLIEKKDENLYVSLPKLKSHSMSQVTFSLKNQFGLVHQASRVTDHNFRIHAKFADIYRVIRPDFVLIDGLIATNHGHYIAKKVAPECIVNTEVLIGGKDPLAVDVCAAKFLGFDLKDVLHLALAAQTGLGNSDFDSFEIIGKELFTGRAQNFTCELLERFPPELVILRGPERCCKEGCRRNTESVVELFYCDHQGRGDFTILMGKGIPQAEVDKITGRVHLAGNCAISDHGLSLVRRLGKKNVTFSHGCNSLPQTVAALCKHMGVSPLNLSGTDPFTALTALVSAKARGTRACIPPLLPLG